MSERQIGLGQRMDRNIRCSSTCFAGVGHRLADQCGGPVYNSELAMQRSSPLGAAEWSRAPAACTPVCWRRRRIQWAPGG